MNLKDIFLLFVSMKSSIFLLYMRYDKMKSEKAIILGGTIMSNILVFGHKNPDTDTITSAIVYAYLKQQLGVNAEAVRLGEVNNETKFALDKFGFEAPRLIANVAEEAKQVILS